ncbi:peptidase S8/S53 domain-containing protein [Massariosphaeria phaeospora]|uniref:Peptidase S8/S53 domain-containing protein n=1 Tax=Massariosphaeria phaeospora TaxID=100035 RepID=A0A7C8II89_9PLEO|nr:peptidase S8/S53 domain-containing protein [Massariosphaeria phaeospora]
MDAADSGNTVKSEDVTVSETSHLTPRASRFYTVYPSDPENAAELSETVTFLRSIADKDVLDNRNAATLISWRVSLTDEASTEKLKGHKGIRMFEPEDSPLGLRSIERREDEEPTTWLVWATDPNNIEQVNETRSWLDSKVKDPERTSEWLTLRDPKEWDKQRLVEAWGSLTLDEKGVEEAKKHPGIKSVIENMKFVHFTSSSRFKYRGSGDLKARAPDLEWTKQSDAVKDLVMNSQYKDADLDKLKDFVHEKRAGEQVVMYIIDSGINIRVKSNDKEQFHYDTEEKNRLQSLGSRALGQDPWTDEDPDAHGTTTASKAAGLIHGVAKSAHVIPVKVLLNSDNVREGFELVRDHIMTRKLDDDPRNSIVLSSLGSIRGAIAQEYKDSDFGKRTLQAIKDIMNVGAPVVLAAGDSPTKGSPVDTFPQILESKDLPLINVGAAHLSGHALDESALGDQVTIYAPGVDVVVHGKNDNEHGQVTGTSPAAPAVAGVIATYQNYAPWGEMEGEYIEDIKAIKKYIQSPQSSWERQKGVNMIWNGADKGAHEKAGANMCKRDECAPPPPPPPPPPPEPVKTCNGIYNKRYIIQELMANVITNQFCPDAVAQGRLDDNSESISRTYFPGSMEEVTIAMDWSRNVAFTPNFDDCKKYMEDLLTGCDTTFPMHWKGGGNIHVGTENVVYRWQPVTTRQIPMPSPWGGCDFTNKALLESYHIYGAGWLSSGFGHELHDSIDSKTSVTNWKFNYAVGSDGREWDAHFNTPIWVEKHVEGSIREVANYPGFGIECYKT